MRRTKLAIYPLIGAVAILLVVLLGSSSAFATTFVRPISESTNVANAIKLSTNTYSSGAETVVLTCSDNYYQSVSSSVLAAAYDAPLLLTSSASLTADVSSELTRLKPTKVFLVGLPSGIAASVKAVLPQLTGTDQITSILGADCYETAALVSAEVEEKVGAVTRVVLVPSDSSGYGATAVAIAAGKGWPVLLTPSAGPVPDSTVAAIQSLGATSAVIVGTQVTPAIAGFTVAKRIVGTPTVTDPYGVYDVSNKLAVYAYQQGWTSFSNTVLVGGSDSTGGLLMAAHVGQSGGTLLLTTTASLWSGTLATLKTYGDRVSQVEFMGMGWPIFRQVKSLNSPRVTALSKSSGPVSGGTSLTVTGTGLSSAVKVKVGKNTVDSSGFRVNSSTSLTIASLPASYGAGPVEVMATNYWGDSPSSTKDVYRYSDGSVYPADKVVTEALKYLGTPYLWAGASPTSGFDCSGLMLYVYSKFGYSLPHYSGYQANLGTAVNPNDLVPGDLIFFYTPISHVGMYVGGGMMINAPRSGDLVTIENAYRTSLVKARRLIPYTSTKRYDQGDFHLSYSGAWRDSIQALASGGNFCYTNSAGAVATVKFTGTGVSLIAKKDSVYGIAKVTVDSGTPAYVDLYSSTAAWQQRVWTSATLASGSHTVTIEWTGTKNRSATDTYVDVDAVEIVGTIAQASSMAGATRVEEGDSRLVNSGVWSTWVTSSASGGSMGYANSTGSSTTISFTGTYLGWMGMLSPQYGIAKVTLDDKDPAYVDLYSPVSTLNRTVWSSGILASGGHKVKIEWTGTKNVASTNTYIGTDAFEIAGTVSTVVDSPAASVTRYQQTDSRLAYAGTWYPVSTASASGGSFKYGNSSGVSVTLKFTGTSLTWIAKKSSAYGKAKVTLDNLASTTVDLYSASVMWAQKVWSTGGLASGAHTVKIEWTGAKNSASTGCNVGADAFDIVGTLVNANTTAATGLTKKVVVIDPGHQQYANTATEPVGPGSKTMKMKVTGGTKGVSTHIAESQFVLDLGLQLRDVLKAKGITVVMTRTTQAVNLSNIDRAKIANNAHANLVVRIHADGWTDASYHGLKVLYPASIAGWTDDIAAASKSAATIVQSELIKATGAKNLGIVARSDLTGFNWSNVPVILPEVGFMTNVAEDKLMATKAYRDKLVNGMAQGIIRYLSSN